MTNDDFKQILDEALKPIKEEQTEFRKKLDEVNEGLSEVKNTIESRVLPPLIYIETTVKGYADSYKINDSNIRKMEKRLETLEEDANVDIPPELRLEPLPETPFPQ